MMEYISAYIMLEKTGNEVTEKSIKNLFRCIDAPVEDETVNLFISKVGDRKLDEIIAKGTEIMSSMVLKDTAAQQPVTETVAAVKDEGKVAVEEPDEEFDMFGDF